MRCMNGWAVSGIRSPDRRRDLRPGTLETFPSVDALPTGAEVLFLANPGLFNSPGWWRTVLAVGMPAGSRAIFLLYRLRGAPAALLPLRAAADGELSALSTPYTCLYRPLLAPGLDADAQHAVFAAFARFCRARAATRFDALDETTPELGAWVAAARASRLAVLRFDCFGNWHEPVAGLDWQAYLAARQGALRETIRRRLRRAERDNRVTVRIVQHPEEIEAGIAAYEDVYARSWKEPEPFPLFNAALMRVGVQAKWLRLGILRVDDRPVAVQLWAVEHGVATVLKLAHDEAYKAMSPGTVLTAWMLRHLLDAEHVSEIDFGRGDDGYKQGWANQRRQRIGLVLVNPFRPAGLMLLARHGLGRVRRRLRPGPVER